MLASLVLQLPCHYAVPQAAHASVLLCVFRHVLAFKIYSSSFFLKFTICNFICKVIYTLQYTVEWLAFTIIIHPKKVLLLCHFNSFSSPNINVTTNCKSIYHSNNELFIDYCHSLVSCIYPRSAVNVSLNEYSLCICNTATQENSKC